MKIRPRSVIGFSLCSVVCGFAATSSGAPVQAALKANLCFGISYQTYVDFFGAFCFGGVIGWLTSEFLFKVSQFGVTQLASLVGVIGGAAVTNFFNQRLFGAYCVGLGVAFFLGVILKDREIEKL